MQLNLKLHIGKLINENTMQYERMVMFQGMGLHNQMRDYLNSTYGAGNWKIRKLTETQYHLESAE